MAIDWHCGTPSIGEWNGAWRANESETEVTQEEWQASWTSLDDWLSRLGKNGFKDDCDFFLRSTWFPDHRSQVIELVNPKALTMEFLSNIQNWIRECFPNWRVIIPLFLGESKVVVVYRDVIRGGSEFESNRPAALEQARRAMLDLDQFIHLRGAPE